MRRQVSRHGTRFFATALALAVFSCAGSTTGGTAGGCGGGCMGQIPGGYKGEKSKNAVVARISPDGFNYLNTNWQTLIGTVMPTAKPNPQNSKELLIPFSFPCTHIPDPGYGVGDIFVCDNGAAGVGSSGFMDGKCDGSDNPCPILITLESLKLSPQGPSSLAAQIKLRIDALRDINNLNSTCKNSPGNTTKGTNCDIFLDSDSKTSACVFTKRMGCYANFYSNRQGRSDEVLDATIQFSLDKNWDDLLTFDIPNGIGGIDQIEANDIVLSGTDRLQSNGSTEDMCDYACSLVGVSFIKDQIIKFVKPKIDQMIKDTIATQRCRKCNPADATVPACPSGSSCVCPPGQSGCQNTAKICQSDSAHGGQCVPLLLGMEGRLDPTGTLGAYGVDSKTRLDVFAAAGGNVAASSDLVLGVLGGAKAPTISPCVPTLTPPTPAAVPDPNAALASGPANHHVGIAVSEYFINSAAFQAHQAGALCLNMSSSKVSLLSTGLFKTFLPSLGVLAGTDTRDAPVLVALRPKAAPEVLIGKGTFDPVTKKPIDPLITLGLKDVNIDFYALIDDRFVRLFTLTADISLPLSLIVEGCPQTITPAIGDLKQLITNIKTSNSELLAEDPAVLAQLIPSVIGLAEPALAGALKGFAVPDMNGFRLKIAELDGINPKGGSGFYHLGLFGEIKLAGQCASTSPETFAKLISSRIPAKEEMRLVPGGHLPWPQATVEVSSLDVAGNGRLTEYGYRIDGGLWSTWTDGPRLEIEHPAFLIQGKHIIEVRSRIAGDSETADPTPAQVEFLVDWEAPEVALHADAASNALVVDAHDVVSPAEKLLFAYKLGDEPVSEFGPARPIDLAAATPFGRVEVQVKDEAGNIASAVWRAQKTVVPVGGEAEAASGGTQAASSSGFGCSAGGEGLSGLFAFALMAAPLLRRRRS